jgi:uncharacterized protein (TIGR02271 family)
MASMTGNRRMLTAFFDSREDANEAIERLVRAGISRGEIRMVEGSSSSGASTVTRDDEGPGFWEALKDLFLPDEDRATYAEGLRRGGYVVTVQASDASYERALDILDDEGTVDLDQRSETWRGEGWSGTGYSSTTATSGAGGALGPAGMSSAMDSTSTGVRSTTGMGSTSTGLGAGARASAAIDFDRTRSTKEGEEAIPIVEEELNVGKRQVEGGRVRVRSYVVETPVQEQVNLREERVHVERRPTDRPLTGSDNVFQDRTIEVEEKSEEAVVSKDARVKEELVVKKDVEQRTETVSDTVRRTEVEVEDERGRTTGTGTTGASTDRKR